MHDDDAAPLLPKGTIVHLIGFLDTTAANKNPADARNWAGGGRRSIANMFIDLGYRSTPGIHSTPGIKSTPGVQSTPAAALSETSSGTILHVHLNEAGQEVDQQQLSLPVTIGSNLQGPAIVEVAIDNGDAPPLPITAIRLEMRQRRLCFNAPPPPIQPQIHAPSQSQKPPPTQPQKPPSIQSQRTPSTQSQNPPSSQLQAQTLTLYYGDPSLPAPQYGFARLFVETPATATARLGPEQANPLYRPRPDARPLTERHPDTLWVALLAVIALLAIAAFRSAKKLPH